MDETVAKKPSILSSYYVRIIGTLFVITAVVAILLSLVNMITKPTIDRLAEEKRQASMVAVMPSAEFYSPLFYNGGDKAILDVEGAFAGSDMIGYCVQVSTNGFGGAIELMVGIDAQGAVTGVEILSQGETAGLGARCTEEAFRAQFAGRSGQIGVSKTSSDGRNIQAISGATITSKAVTNGVNAALTAITHIDLEGGEFDE